MKHRFLSRILTAVLLSALLLPMMPVKTRAAADSFSNAASVSLGERRSITWTKANYSSTTYLKVTVSGSGFLSILMDKPVVEGNSKPVSFAVYSQDQVLLGDTDSIFETTFMGDTFGYTLGVSQGTYYFAIKPGFTVSTDSVTTYYTVSFTADASAEREPNNTVSKAQYVNFGTLYSGYIDACATTVDHDYYGYKMDAGKEYTLIVSGGYMFGGEYSIMDPNGSVTTFDVWEGESVGTEKELVAFHYRATVNGYHFLVVNGVENHQWKYFFKMEQAENDGWVERDGKWYYYRNGVYLIGYPEIDGVRYLFGQDGALVQGAGWVKPDNQNWWIYNNADGSLAKGWQQIGGKWYWFDEEISHMATNWKEIGGKWYYFGADGAMKTGWKEIGGKWYYFGADGAMKTGWKEIGGKLYLLGSDGSMKTGWAQDGGKWYYLGSDGSMKTGWAQDGGKWYYLGSDGAMKTGWIQVNGNWYYLNSEMKTGWQQIGGKWYFFSSGGSMAKGWKQIGSTWYFLGSNGAMKTGWQKVDGIWYYLEDDGAMAVGLRIIDYTFYYFKSSGAMAVNEKIVINGVEMFFDSHGAGSIR